MHRPQVSLASFLKAVNVNSGANLVGALITDHPLRATILKEMHARPYRPVATPHLILRTAFFSDPATKLNDDYEVFRDWCTRKNITPPPAASRHHTVTLMAQTGGPQNCEVNLTWERHTEFSTLTWECKDSPQAQKCLEHYSKTQSGEIIASPLVLISASLLRLSKASKGLPAIEKVYDRESLCKSYSENKKAMILTDFRQNNMGATRFNVINKSMDEIASGVLIRRILEIETYRSMALLGYAEVMAAQPKLARLERQIIILTGEMGEKKGLEATRQTLDEITTIAGQLTNLSAKTEYRLSATRAYYKLVLGRLKRINEIPIEGYSKIEEFLARRLAPAMRSCENIESRIHTAGEKLASAAALLRTKVDIQMQVQNNSLLESMDERAKQQYRLQSTVEGLSIAAVSYYIIGLLAYIFKGIGFQDPSTYKKLIAVFVPIVLLLVWAIIRRIRQAHDKD